MIFPMNRWSRIQQEYIRVEEEVARMKEFRGLDTFAVVLQPWSKKSSVNKTNDIMKINIKRIYMYITSFIFIFIYFTVQIEW